jgi:hypothetical protein
MDDVAQISFETSMSNCKSVWAANLWTTPNPWLQNQHSSGEIDFVENCAHSLNISFGETSQYYAQWPGKNADNLTRQRVTITFDQAKDEVTTQMCSIDDPSQCVSAMTRKGYFADSAHNWRGRGRNFSLVSDLWDGTNGNEGYWGCQGKTDPNSQCSYQVSNIRFTPRDPNKPVFPDGACAVMNAGGGPPVPPPTSSCDQYCSGFGSCEDHIKWLMSKDGGNHTCSDSVGIVKNECASTNACNCDVATVCTKLTCSDKYCGDDNFTCLDHVHYLMSSEGGNHACPDAVGIVKQECIAKGSGSCGGCDPSLVCAPLNRA